MLRKHEKQSNICTSKLKEKMKEELRHSMCVRVGVIFTNSKNNHMGD